MTWDQWNQPEPGDECEPPVEDGREEWLDGLQGKYGRIHTTYEYPPIPIRTCDWSAVLDDYDGAPDAGPHQYVGLGATEAEAVRDLIEQLEDS